MGIASSLAAIELTADMSAAAMRAASTPDTFSGPRKQNLATWSAISPSCGRQCRTMIQNQVTIEAVIEAYARSQQAWQVTRPRRDHPIALCARRCRLTCRSLRSDRTTKPIQAPNEAHMKHRAIVDIDLPLHGVGAGSGRDEILLFGGVVIAPSSPWRGGKWRPGVSALGRCATMRLQERFAS